RADRIHDEADRLCRARRAHGLCEAALRSAERRGCPPVALAEPDSGTEGMTRLPQIALLYDGRRLHLQDGPIDLIVEARGAPGEGRAAYEGAAQRFAALRDELCAAL